MLECLFEKVWTFCIQKLKSYNLAENIQLTSVQIDVMAIYNKMDYLVLKYRYYLSYIITFSKAHP